MNNIPSVVNCFTAYDIRGRIPDGLNENIAWRVGRAYAARFSPKEIVVGRDVRLTSSSLSEALTKGLMDGGVDVIDIGLCGTEEVYFQTFHRKVSGGIMVTASHNPMDYNGMKLVREEARPVSGDSGLADIRSLVEQKNWTESKNKGCLRHDEDKSAYLDHLLGYIERSALLPLKIVVNAGNGCAGPILDLLETYLPFELIKIHHTPDGTFPNGIPNPLLPEGRAATTEAVIESGADLGLAWDGDFDRCFFFDEKGNFIEGYYLVGLLAESFLASHPGAKIIHDPRLTWNTIDVVQRAGGKAVQCKTGHAFIKERMRQEKAVYGGEMSAHHYFSDFSYCDSGMIPWLLVAELLSQKGGTLSALIDERQHAFPCSGEINYRVKDVAVVLRNVEEYFAPTALVIDRTDGLSLEFVDWRFNLRASNTEPLLRLNVETRADQKQVIERVTEIESLM